MPWSNLSPGSVIFSRPDTGPYSIRLCRSLNAQVRSAAHRGTEAQNREHTRTGKTGTIIWVFQVAIR